MVGGRWSKFVALCLFVAALGGTLAPAAVAQGEPDTGAFNAFNLKASNGYRMVVWAASGKGYRHGQILILVGRKREAVTYFAPAKVTDVRVVADLGAFGAIDVSFQPSGEKGVDHPVCDSRQRVRYEKGAYIGAIDFHGEEGFTEVHAESARLSLHPFIDFICAGSGEGRGEGFPGAALLVRSKARAKRVALQVNQNRPGARVHVSASTDEQRGRIAIFREVAATYPSGAFHFDPQLRKAVLSPPAPFAGTGLFHRDASPANRWTGNLRADFPGRSNVPLAGSGFAVNLVHASYEGKAGRAPLNRPNLNPWPSTKPSPTAFATPSLLAPR
jgi:hypothetical protein